MRVPVREILADPVQRRELLVRCIYAIQAAEDPTMTMERAYEAYDKAQALSKDPGR